MKKRYEDTQEVNRKKIIRAACELFSRAGFEQVTMNSIATLCSLSKKTVYEQFRTKEAIYLEAVLISFCLLDKTVQKSLHNIPQTVGRAEGRAFFFRLCASLATLYKTDPLSFSAMLRFSNPPDPKEENRKTLTAIYAAGERVNEELARFLRILENSGQIKKNLPVIPTIFSLWAAISGIIPFAHVKNAYLENAAAMSDETFMEYAFELLYRAISV